ncbi:hypothetical protein AB0M20_40030, partial [Actinoplanes sp. NPDC051633]|uniref:hypothetical protein n=1 Tax=Actinoplanes sp. NPDC051633 TaxID=3155670 RepID=UPI003434C590
MREIEILPTMYQENADFVNLTVNSVSGSLKDEQTIEDLYARLDDFALSLEAIPPALGNFALFAFRGFYYQELAHLLSLSYMPHSWRSNLIRSQLEQPVTRFTDLAVSAGGKIRRDLAAAINAEFATQALSVDFPLIASYVIGQTDSRADLLKTAVEVRNSPKATAFRTWLYETERRIRHERDLREVRRAQDELNTLVRELEVDFGLRNAPKQEIKFKLGLPVPNGPSIEGPVHLGLPRWVRRAMQRRTHLVFLRELAQESVSLPPFLHAYRSLQP